MSVFTATLVGIVIVVEDITESRESHLDKSCHSANVAGRWKARGARHPYNSYQDYFSIRTSE